MSLDGTLNKNEPGCWPRDVRELVESSFALGNYHTMDFLGYTETLYTYCQLVLGEIQHRIKAKSLFRSINS